MTQVKEGMRIEVPTHEAPKHLASAPGRQSAGFDLIIIGAGLAAVSAALTAAEQAPARGGYR